MVAVHRSRLPIASPCDGFEPAAGATGDGGYCLRCAEPVHDLSAMRPRELRRFLAARRGQRVCVSYRTDARGMLRLRPEPRPVLLGAVAMLLVACAGHLEELESPDAGCVDANGYEVACTEADWELRTVPNAAEAEAEAEARARESEGEGGCPVIRHDGVGQPGSPAVAESSGREGHDPDAPRVGPASAEAVGTDAQARVDALLDPEREVPLRGMIVVGEWEDRPFVPTEQLWKSAKERRAERRAARRRYRQRG